MSLVPDELMLNLDGLELKVFYHWQNPNEITRLRVMYGMQNRASVQRTMKCLQALAPSIKIPINAMQGLGLSM